MGIKGQGEGWAGAKVMDVVRAGAINNPAGSGGVPSPQERRRDCICFGLGLGVGVGVGG